PRAWSPPRRRLRPPRGRARGGGRARSGRGASRGRGASGGRGEGVMLALRGFLALLKRDFLLELRRRETVVNMTLFAVLILFVSSYALVGRAEANEAGPIFLWVAMLFAGTVGLSRAFQGEREGGALYGILAAPIDPAVLYLA